MVKIPPAPFHSFVCLNEKRKCAKRVFGTKFSRKTIILWESAIETHTTQILSHCYGKISCSGEESIVEACNLLFAPNGGSKNGIGNISRLRFYDPNISTNTRVIISKIGKKGNPILSNQSTIN